MNSSKQSVNPDRDVPFLRSVGYQNFATNTAYGGTEKVLCVWAAPKDIQRIHEPQRFDLYELAKNSEIGMRFYHDAAFRWKALEQASEEYTKAIMDGVRDPGGSQSPSFQVQIRRNALDYFIKGWSIRPEVSKIFAADPMSGQRTPISTYRMVLVPANPPLLAQSKRFEEEHGIATPPYALSIRHHSPKALSESPSPAASRKNSIKSRSPSVGSHASSNRRRSSASSHSSATSAAAGGSSKTGKVPAE